MSLLSPLDNLLTVVYHSGMSLSRDDEKRWVIQGVDVHAIRTAKSMAAEHGVRVADIVSAVLNDAWRKYCDGDTGEDDLWRLIGQS